MMMRRPLPGSATALYRQRKERAMAIYYVTKVCKEKDRKDKSTHEHIIGVCTNTGQFYSNQEIVDSLQAGNEWYTSVAGEPMARIESRKSCTYTGCNHKPYLKTEADPSKKNNLENLPHC
jgi:hypothetical protein